ncbi:MAG: hypothetical protein IAF94_23265, partial [Pirellulaceae bacterium]|nr:hypothetical protein [Pirellulaceae bacterium]
NNLGDLALHLTYIEHLAKGAQFWPDNPIFAGERLHYPLGVDLLNGLLTLAGLDVVRGLIWVGLLGSLMTGYLLWRWGGGFTLAGFLWNGGLAGFAVWQGGLYDYQAELAWKSLPLSMLVTQRGLLYALPAGLLLLWQWRRRWLENAGPIMPRWVEVLLYATLPLFHLHTFLFLSLLLGCWGIWPNFPFRRDVIVTVALAFIPASLLVWLVSGGPGATSGLHFRPGWMQGDQNFFAFWMLNFGGWLVLAAALLWRLARDRDSAAWKLVGPACGIFLLCCFVMFSHWPWDNTKLMIWSYLIALPFLGRLIEPWVWPTRALACVCLFTSGSISIMAGMSGSGHTLASRSELAKVRVATADLSPNATFAAEPTYNHPLLLIGHKLVLGYDGHLWSHGIDYRPRQQELRQLMKGGQDWQETARRLGVRYLFWGDREKAAYPDSWHPWTAFEPVASGTWGSIYDVEAIPPRLDHPIRKLFSPLKL